VKLGIVLPSWMYSDERKKLAADTFYSLMETEPLMEETRLLLLVKAGNSQDYLPMLDRLSRKFTVVVKTDEGLVGTEQTLAYGTSFLIDNYGVEYVTWMGDDALFHPMWLWKLNSLIQKHPNARAWSVYRSSFEFVHRTIKVVEDSVLVRSICGHGMTFSKDEWLGWGIKWDDPKTWELEPGATLDIMHPHQRPGERWVTKESWLEHTGRVGLHCTPDVPEYARNFQMV